MQQLTVDLESLPGLIVGIALVLTAIGLFSWRIRARINHKLTRAGWIALGVGTLGLTAWGYFDSLIS